MLNEFGQIQNGKIRLVKNTLLRTCEIQRRHTVQCNSVTLPLLRITSSTWEFSSVQLNKCGFQNRRELLKSALCKEEND